MNPDEKDEALFALRAEERAKIAGQLVGDWILMRDGTTRRFTYRWPGDSKIQTTKWDGDDHGFHVFKDGHMSFSGTLGPGIPLDDIEPTDESRAAYCWIFHHDQVGAHRGVWGRIPCRVFRQRP